MGSVSRCAFRLFCFLVVVRARPIMTPNNFNLPPNVSLIPPPILELYVSKTTITVSEATTTKKAGLVKVTTTKVPETTATASTLPASTSTELLEPTITVLSTTENSTSTSQSTTIVTEVESTTPPRSTPIDSIITTTTTFPFSLRAVSFEITTTEEVTALPCEFETDASQPSTP